MSFIRGAQLHRLVPGGDTARAVKEKVEGGVEEGVATHARIRAQRVPQTEEPGGLPSTGSQSRTRDACEWHLLRNPVLGIPEPLWPGLTRHILNAKTSPSEAFLCSR